VCVGGDFTSQNHQAGVTQGLGSYTTAWVLLENSVENSVRNLVSYLVWVTFRDGFGCEEKIASHKKNSNKVKRTRCLKLFGVASWSSANALADLFNVALQVVQLTQRPYYFSYFLLFCLDNYHNDFCFQMFFLVTTLASTQLGCRFGLDGFPGIGYLQKAIFS
jgi:hypothetical protein